MSTAIERFLYGDLGIHGIIGFTAEPGLVRINLTPWEGPKVHTVAVFREAQISSVEAYPDVSGDLEWPWDVIGFDCYGLGDGRWRFVLHCDAIEWCFELAWPTIERSGASRSIAAGPLHGPLILGASRRRCPRAYDLDA